VSAARIVVHVVPRAKTTELAGMHGDAVRIRVAAPPADGAANAALVRFIADRLGIPVARVRIISGATARRKTLEVEGYSAGSLKQMLLSGN
jgi:uncharacterized protein (TIGR00251 family)